MHGLLNGELGSIAGQSRQDLFVCTYIYCLCMYMFLVSLCAGNDDLICEHGLLQSDCNPTSHSAFFSLIPTDQYEMLCERYVMCSIIELLVDMDNDSLIVFYLNSFLLIRL